MKTEKPHNIPRDEDLDLEDFSIEEFFRLHGQRYIVFEKDPYQIAHCVVFTADRVTYLEYMIYGRLADLGYDRRILSLIGKMNRQSLDYLADGIIRFEKVVQGEALCEDVW